MQELKPQLEQLMRQQINHQQTPTADHQNSLQVNQVNYTVYDSQVLFKHSIDVQGGSLENQPPFDASQRSEKDTLESPNNPTRHVSARPNP